MFKLVECRNPNIRKAIVDGRRYNNKGDLDFLYCGEVKLCKWCCSKPTRTNRHAYCSDKCQHSATVLMIPQSRQGAVYLLLRQRFKCGGCDYSWKEVFRDILGYIKRNKDFSPRHVTAWEFGRLISGNNGKRGCLDPERTERYGIRRHLGAQVDHIIPIWEGGTSFGFENLQVLCVQCHQIKTTKENSRRKR